MKNMKTTFCTILFALTSTSTFASTFDDMQVFTKAAYADFAANNAEHVQHFNGFKTWISGAETKVKIYVNHGGMAMEYNYSCKKQGQDVSCDAQ
jgi:hypothetical protein